MPMMTFSISANADIQKVEGAVRETIQQVAKSSGAASPGKTGSIKVTGTPGLMKRPKRSKVQPLRVQPGQEPALLVYKTMRIGTIEGSEGMVRQLKDKINLLDGITEVVIDEQGLSIEPK